MIMLGGWSGLIDFLVVKMDDFDVVLGMEFLLEHQVIPMPLAKCPLLYRSTFASQMGFENDFGHAIREGSLLRQTYIYSHST